MYTSFLWPRQSSSQKSSTSRPKASNRPSSWKFAVEALEPDVLQLGDSGTAVQKLQLALQALSLYTASIDGSFGRKTADAIQLLQSVLELEATGIFDQETWYALTFWAEPSFAHLQP